jgi:hypothetical protein
MLLRSPILVDSLLVICFHVLLVLSYQADPDVGVLLGCSA